MPRRHEGLERLRSVRAPVAIEEATWPGGMGLQISAYVGGADLPDELIVSVRCVVTVNGRVLVFEDASGAVDILPGGRREHDESLQRTAQREVMEETGWHVAEESLIILGFIHLRHTTPVPDDHPFPHPDWLQVVMHGEGSGAPFDWVDTEGYVRHSWLASVPEARALRLSAAGRVFLDVVAGRGESRA